MRILTRLKYFFITGQYFFPNNSSKRSALENYYGSIFANTKFNIQIINAGKFQDSSNQMNQWPEHTMHHFFINISCNMKHLTASTGSNSICGAIL